jgi:hypothetical protein
MRIAVLAGLALVAVLVANLVADNFGKPDRAAAGPAPVHVETAFAAATPIVPAEADGSGQYGYGPARTTDW